MSNAAGHEWLSAQERDPRSLGHKSTLADAVRLFQADTDLRLLPILDAATRPIGAIFEKDVRRLLLNPFGHALLQNPTFNSDLNSFLRPCPTREVTDDIGVLVDHYRRADGREGMMLTRAGRLYATLSNRRLLLLAADREREAAKARLERAERIERAGQRFETQAAALATQMVQLSNSVQRLAEATVDRANIAGNRAAAVASAAVQTRDNMGVVAKRGQGLAAAFAGIESALASSRSAAHMTVERVSSGGQRARNLLEAAHSIDAVMNLVNDIAGTVNLLSLNATIEAARAGEVGRGFAVVAGEIRSLSDQTHEATQRIGSQIEALRSGVATMVGDYQEVEAAIETMVDSSAHIDRAITQEADTTRLIATSVGEASSASHMIEESVSTIVNSVRSASTSARELDSLANQLRQGASALGNEVSMFLAEVRAA
ncbi:MAG: methyl-accepting chemotaxis protein [Pseudomonadota bacterium]|nr:methyl-accepting chemotaxis protein [Pseudomonadota bacterium]